MRTAINASPSLLIARNDVVICRDSEAINPSSRFLAEQPSSASPASGQNTGLIFGMIVVSVPIDRLMRGGGLHCDGDDEDRRVRTFRAYILLVFIVRVYVEHSVRTPYDRGRAG